MITAERKVEINNMKAALSIDELLTLSEGELGLMAFNDTGRVFKAHLKSLVLEADSSRLINILDKFNDHEVFYFLEDLICAGKVPSMTKDQYWDYIGD